MIRTLTALLSALFFAPVLATHGVAVLATHGVDGDVDGDEKEAAESAEDVLRVYDVSTLRVGDGVISRGEWDGTLLPYIQYHVADPGEPSEEERGGADALVDLIVDLYGPEFEYEGRRVSVSGDGRLAVRGPEGLHARVAGLIGFFESAVNAQTTITMDVLTFPTNLPPEAARALARMGESSVFPIETAQQLIDLARDTGHHESYPLNVRADRVTMLDLARDEAVVTDLDVEIAQGAAIQDPIVTIVSVGTRLVLRAAPGDEGTFMALTLKRASWVDGTRSHDLQLRFNVASEGGELSTAWHVHRLPNPQVLARSMSFSTFLPHDRALAISTRVDLERDSVSEIVLLRHTGGGLPMRHELPLGQDGARVIFADLGSVAPPRAVASGILLDPGYVPHTLESYHRHVMLDATLERGDVDFVLDLIDSGQDYTSLELFGRWMVSRPYGSSSDDAAAARAEQERLVAAMDAIRPGGDVLDLSITVREVGEEASTPVETLLPVRPGCSATIALGIEGVEVFDYDVEVAQYAATPDPITRTSFDGLCLWVKPTPTTDGRMQLEVRGGANLWVEDQEVDLGSPLYRFVDGTVHEHLFVNERVVLEERDGAYRLSLGDTGSGGPDGGLRIDVTVRRR